MPGLEGLSYGEQGLSSYLDEFWAKQIREQQKLQQVQAEKAQKQKKKQQNKVPLIVKVLSHRAGSRKYCEYFICRYYTHTNTWYGTHSSHTHITYRISRIIHHASHITSRITRCDILCTCLWRLLIYNRKGMPPAWETYSNATKVVADKVKVLAYNTAHSLTNTPFSQSPPQAIIPSQ